MVKITNDFGDKYVGTSGTAIYQLVYGKQVRRRGYKESKLPTARQLQVRQRFKDAIAWTKTLSYEDRYSLKKLYQTSNLAYDKKYPVNWYNFAKWLYIQDPKFKLLNPETNQYQIKHPALLSIKEYDNVGVLLFSDEGLSTFENPNLDKTYIHTPIIGASRIEISLLTGLTNEHTLGIPVPPVPEMIYYETEYYDSAYYE